MKSIEISFKNHVLHLLPQIFMVIVALIFVIWNFGIENLWNEQPILGIFSASILLVSLPAIYIHYSYYLENKGAHFLIYPDKIVDAKSRESFTSDEIQKIIIHHSNKNNSRPMPWEEYRYCEVKLKNGKTIILTSLLKKNIGDFLKENLKGVLFELDDSFFASFI